MNRRFEVDRLAPHLRDLAHLDLAAVEIGVEQGHAERRFGDFFERRRARQDQHLFGDLRGRDPDLAARQHVTIATAHRARLQMRRVETGIGLGHRKAGLFAARDQRRQKAALLLVGAENHDRMQPKDVHMDRRGAAEPGPGLGHRLHQHRRLGDAEPAAAISRRHGDAEPPAIGHRPVEFMRKAALSILGEPVIVAKALAQPGDRGPDLPLLLGQLVGHARLHPPQSTRHNARAAPRIPLSSPWRSAAQLLRS